MSVALLAALTQSFMVVVAEQATCSRPDACACSMCLEV